MLARKLTHILITIVLLAAAGVALWFWGALTYVYSAGERAGYVQKISKRGWVFKTWEGELAMVNLPGAMQEKFFFTVRDEKVAEQVQAVNGQRVVITYEQHRFLPSNLFGETEYFVVGVKPFQEAAPAALPTPAPAPTAAPAPAKTH